MKEDKGKITSIKLHEATRKALEEYKVHPRETFEQLIRRIVLDQKEVQKR